MRPGTDKLIAKAERAAEIAGSALEAGAPDIAAGRAFYAMLYAAKALLNERGIRYRGHARIAAAVESPLREHLIAAIEQRRRVEEISVHDVSELLERARACVAAANQRL